jgi:hypothetical protein
LYRGWELIVDSTAVVGPQDQVEVIIFEPAPAFRLISNELSKHRRGPLGSNGLAFQRLSARGLSIHEIETLSSGAISRWRRLSASHSRQAERGMQP